MRLLERYNIHGTQLVPLRPVICLLILSGLILVLITWLLVKPVTPVLPPALPQVSFRDDDCTTKIRDLRKLGRVIVFYDTIWDNNTREPTWGVTFRTLSDSEVELQTSIADKTLCFAVDKVYGQVTKLNIPPRKP